MNFEVKYLLYSVTANENEDEPIDYDLPRLCDMDFFYIFGGHPPPRHGLG